MKPEPRVLLKDVRLCGLIPPASLPETRASQPSERLRGPRDPEPRRCPSIRCRGSVRTVALRRGSELRQPPPRQGREPPCPHPEFGGRRYGSRRGGGYQPAVQLGGDDGLGPLMAGPDRQGGRRVTRDLIANDEAEVGDVVRWRLFENLGSATSAFAGGSPERMLIGVSSGPPGCLWSRWPRPA